MRIKTWLKEIILTKIINLTRHCERCAPIKMVSDSEEQKSARKRATSAGDTPRYQPLPDDWDPDLPFGGKVYLARKKKPDPTWVKVVEVCVLLFAVWLAYYTAFHFDSLHFHVTKAYAHIGHDHAQHLVGQKFLQGKGVKQDHKEAIKWFKKASDQGHPYAAYNYAVAHLQGYETDLKPGDAHRLIKHAADRGVKEAHKVLKEVCQQGGCD